MHYTENNIHLGQFQFFPAQALQLLGPREWLINVNFSLYSSIIQLISSHHLPSMNSSLFSNCTHSKTFALDPVMYTTRALPDLHIQEVWKALSSSTKIPSRYKRNFMGARALNVIHTQRVEIRLQAMRRTALLAHAIIVINLIL